MQESRAKAQEALERQEANEARIGQGLEAEDDQGESKGYDHVVAALGLEEDEEKPFWAKYLKTDHEKTEPTNLVGGVLAVLEGEKDMDEFLNEQKSVPEDEMALELYQGKQEDDDVPSRSSSRAARTPENKEKAKAEMEREWARIRDLETKLGRANKAQQDMAAKMQEHRLKMEAMLSKAEELEEEKREVSKAYDKKNRRGLTSQMAATEKKQPAASKPPI